MTKLWLTKEVLEEAVKRSHSFNNTVVNLGTSTHGGNVDWITKKIKRFEINTSHFIGNGQHPWNKGMKGTAPYRKSKEELLVIYTDKFLKTHAHQLRRAMMESGILYKCNRCNIKEWNNEKINLEINHINGNRLNCLLSNLEFICPNCHSQTEKFKNYRKKSER